MDTVSLVVGSPRGRYFCANVGYACSDDRDHPNALVQSPDEVLDAIQSVDTAAVERLSEIELLAALGLAVDMARYWQPPDREDLMFARPDISAALRPIAHAVLASARTRWWADPVDLGDQHVVEKLAARSGWSELPPRIRCGDDHLESWRNEALATELQFREYLNADPSRQISGEWWSAPVTGGSPVTTRAWGELGPLGLRLDEDENSDYTHARVWPVKVHGTPRVYEITGPADWARLVDTFPLPVPASRRSVWYDATGERHDWFIPDWQAVATDYDAVHLTVLGYLTSAGIAIPLTEHTGATVLAGWDPDATFWLRSDFITVDADPRDWSWTDQGPWVPA